LGVQNYSKQKQQKRKIIDMKRLSILNIIQRNQQVAERNRMTLIQLAGENIPWQGRVGVGSTQYVIYIFDPTEVGKPNPFGQANQLFRMVKVDGSTEVILDEGEILGEKIETGQVWTRRIWIKGKKLVDLSIVTPEDRPPSPTSCSSQVSQSFKDLVAGLVRERK